MAEKDQDPTTNNLENGLEPLCAKVAMTDCRNSNEFDRYNNVCHDQRYLNIAD